MTASSCKVAAAQFAPVFLNRTESVEKACDIIGQAGKAGARLVVFPESFLPGYPDWTWVTPNYSGPQLDALYSRLVDNAMTVGDASTKRLCDAAKKARIHVVMGMTERNGEASNSSVYNSILFIDDTGQMIGTHRKLVPTGAERFVWAQGDGSTLDVHRTSIGRIGGLVCWENFMPMARQALYNQGMEILASPTWDKSENWITSIKHIAREGGVFVISCCTALRMADVPDDVGFKEHYPGEREWINAGNSCIVNPKGQIVAGPLSEEEGLVIAEIDLAQNTAARRVFDAAGHYARPDVFDFFVRRR